MMCITFGFLKRILLYFTTWKTYKCLFICLCFNNKTNLNGNWACVIIFFIHREVQPVRCKKLYKWSSLQMMLHFNIRIIALWNKLHKTVRRCYWYTLLLRIIKLYLIYKEDLPTNLPRCWYNCASSTLYASILILVCYDRTTLFWTCSKISVLGA